MRRESKSEYATMVFENGILEGKYNFDIFIDLEMAKEIIEQRKKVTEYKTVPIIVDAREIKGLTKEARSYFGSEAGYELLSAAAILSDSVLSQFIVNFFIKVNLQKTAIPVRLFSNRDKAIAWLEQYK